MFISACSQVDIVLVLDSSGSIGKPNWNFVLDFARAMVRDFPVGVNGARFGKLFLINIICCVSMINLHLDITSKNVIPKLCLLIKLVLENSKSNGFQL